MIVQTIELIRLAREMRMSVAVRAVGSHCWGKSRPTQLSQMEDSDGDEYIRSSPASGATPMGSSFELLQTSWPVRRRLPDIDLELLYQITICLGF